MPARLPVPGSDDGTWGDILNEYLEVSLDTEGKLKPAAVVAAGAVTVAGDIGGTAAVPLVTATHLSAALPIAQGGTGSVTQNFVDLSTVQTVANKAFTPRVVTLTAVSNVYTPVNTTTDLVRIVNPTANFTIANASDTPVDGQKMMMRIISSATAYTPTWGSIYKSSGVATLPTTLVASKTVTCGFIYDSAKVGWILMAVDATGY